MLQVSQKKKYWPLSSSGFPECFRNALFLWSLKAQHKGSKKTRDSENLSGRKVSVYPRKKVENFVNIEKNDYTCGP